MRNKQQLSTRRNFRIAIAVIFTLFLLAFGFYLYQAKIIVPSAQVAGPSLSLSPASTQVDPGNTLPPIEIILNTDSQPIASVDIRYLNFDSQLLEVQSVALGNIMPNTTNRTDNTQGTIELSFGTQEQGGYTGNGVLATITFKALKEGTANVSFDYTPGSTTDSNIWHNTLFPPTDILAGVENGTYTIGSSSTSPPATATATPISRGRKTPKTPTPSPSSQTTENPTPVPTEEPTPEPTSEPIVGTSTPTPPVIIGKASPTPTPKLSPGASPKISPKMSPATGSVAGFALLPKLIWLVYIGVPLLITLIIYLVWSARKKRLPKIQKPTNTNYPKDIDDDLKI